MKAIIAQFYNSAERAEKRVDELRKLWRGKIAWYVLEAQNGWFVISESQAKRISDKKLRRTRNWQAYPQLRHKLPIPI